MSFDSLKVDMSIKCECSSRSMQTLEIEVRGIQTQSTVNLSQAFLGAQALGAWH